MASGSVSVRTIAVSLVVPCSVSRFCATFAELDETENAVTLASLCSTTGAQAGTPVTVSATVPVINFRIVASLAYWGKEMVSAGDGSVSAMLLTASAIASIASRLALTAAAESRMATGAMVGSSA